MGGRLLQSISSHIGGVLGGMLGRRCWNWVWHAFTEGKEQSMVDNRLNMKQLKSLPSTSTIPCSYFLGKRKKVCGVKRRVSYQVNIRGQLEMAKKFQQHWERRKRSCPCVLSNKVFTKCTNHLIVVCPRSKLIGSPDHTFSPCCTNRKFE